MKRSWYQMSIPIFIFRTPTGEVQWILTCPSNCLSNCSFVTSFSHNQFTVAEINWLKWIFKSNSCLFRNGRKSPKKGQNRVFQWKILTLLFDEINPKLPWPGLILSTPFFGKTKFERQIKVWGSGKGSKAPGKLWYIHSENLWNT